MIPSGWNRFQQVLLATLLLLLASAAAPAQRALFEDGFLSRDGQQPPNWRFVGPKGPQYWVVAGGSLDSGDSNAFSLGPNMAVVAASGAESWGDYTVSADIQVTDNDGLGKVMLVARLADNSNYYAASMAFSGTGASGFRLVELLRVQNGAEFVIAESPENAQLPDFGRPGSGPYRLALTVAGGNLRVSLDGKEVVSARDAAFATGAPGLGVLTSRATFDNARVETGAGGSSGGQRTPAAAASGGTWRIVAMGNLTRTDAERQAQELRAQMPVQAEALPGATGDRWGVYIGAYPEEAAAKAEATRLQVEEGVLSSGVEFVEASRGGAAPVVAAGTMQIRVQADSFRNRNQAEQLANTLSLEGGYYPVEVRELGGEYAVLVNLPFETRQLAEGLAQMLRGENYPRAKVREDVPAAGAGAPAVSAADVMNIAKQAGGGLSGAEIDRVAQLVQGLEGTVRSQDAEANQKLRDELRNLSERERELAAQLQQEMRERETAEIRVQGLSSDAATAINAGELERAERMIAEIRQINPQSGAIPALVALLEQKKASAARPSGDTQAEQFAKQAREMEALGDFIGALALWKRVQQATTTGPLYDESRGRVSDLEARIARSTGKSGDGGEGGSNTMVVIIGIVAVVAVGAAIGFVLINKNKRPAPAKAAPPARGTGLGLPPAPGGFAPVTPGGLAPSPAPAPAPAAAQAPAPVQPGAPKKQAQAIPQSDGGVSIDGLRDGVDSTPTPMPVGGDARIRPGTFSPAPNAPTPLAVPGAPTPGMAVTPPAGSPMGTPSSGSVRRPGSDSGSQQRISPPSGEYLSLPSSPEVPLHGGSSGAVPVQGAFPVGVYFEQSFDDEELGAPPRHWKGAYDYASLLISNEGSNGGRCARYEKLKGTGSAYYSCKFPDASGRICAEFDIRCDDKNRYLIGFYIEKDEDFRQSISTIVHRTNPKSEPTLRLQNESHPYKFGSWVHVKYIIDLPRSLVDGWVDDISVAAGVRLTQAPKVINTLSIRDNSATTGILLIDNIRIYRIP
ncbi:MAG: SPOR domain-containing protein [Candidatus Sumerlaeia bacterium]|nr:SPOR domain-containing protein [Candidatus Sumerlaeia bacterium]